MVKDHFKYTQFRNKYIEIYLHLNTIDIVAWTFPLSFAKYHVFFWKMQDFPQKKYSLPLQGIYVSVVLVCSLNLAHWIPVLDVILNTTITPPLLAKKLLSCFCNSPLRKLYKCFFNTQYPYKLWRHPLKDAAFLLKNCTFFQMIGNNPAPYVACCLTCSQCFSMQNLCQKVQCINTIFPENPVRMTILLTDGSYSIRQYGILWIKEACSSKHRR